MSKLSSKVYAAAVIVIGVLLTAFITDNAYEGTMGFIIGFLTALIALAASVAHVLFTSKKS